MIRRRAAPAVLILLVAVAAPACGKKGPPAAPVSIQPAAPRHLQVRQVGEDAVVSALVPPIRTDGTRIERPMVRILRMPLAPGFNPHAVARGYLARRFEKEAKLLATLEGESLARAAPGGRLVFRDPGVLTIPPPGAVPAAPRFLYSVQVQDERGRRSAIPPPGYLEVKPPPPAPTGLRVETAEGELRFSWDPGEGTAAGALFNVYRSQPGDPPEIQVPLNPRPITETSWIDRSFGYDRTYVCFIRAVTEAGTPERESESSPAITLTPRDAYPPKAPAGTAVAIERGTIRLYWFPNDEPDLAGYRIYRRPDTGGEFARIGEVDPSEPSFVDATAAPGVRYHYRVTAIDGAEPPNESAPSEEQSERLPPAAPAIRSRP